ncbi:hypothetical protein EVAR_103789_1 [Eumeta japonica]|uniref:Uncharacterized protein n=1 Tax=Eumeta variegata TaxID=151549 RepID=A0A4C1Z3E0_EUMVA|nr:hypothetical protein EVAR_103789_1 [Eumeta japonica]
MQWGGASDTLLANRHLVKLGLIKSERKRCPLLTTPPHCKKSADHRKKRAHREERQSGVRAYAAIAEIALCQRVVRVDPLGRAEKNRAALTTHTVGYTLDRVTQAFHCDVISALTTHTADSYNVINRLENITVSALSYARLRPRTAPRAPRTPATGVDVRFISTAWNTREALPPRDAIRAATSSPPLCKERACSARNMTMSRRKARPRQRRVRDEPAPLVRPGNQSISQYRRLNKSRAGRHREARRREGRGARAAAVRRDSCSERPQK